MPLPRPRHRASRPVRDRLRSVRRECATLLDALELPPHAGTDDLIEAVATLRGRRVTVLDKDVPGGPCGVWIATDRTDFVFVDADVSGLHRAHITAHELAHVAFDHGGPRVLSADVVERLLPDLDVGRVGAVLGRQSYTTREERQAEVLASMVSRPAGLEPDGPVGGPTIPEVVALTRSIGRRESTRVR